MNGREATFMSHKDLYDMINTTSWVIHHGTTSILLPRSKRWFSPKMANWRLHGMVSQSMDSVKCGKFMEGTLGTLDIKSGPTRYRKGLQLQLMCCTPFRLLSQDFGMGRSEIRDWKIGVSIRVDLRVETRGWIIEVKTYSIFELKYLHDMSEVFMLSIGINKKINWKTRNKQNP